MAENYIALADSIVKADLSEAHLDVQSLAATYKARRKDDDRHALLFARALVRRAKATGVNVDGGKTLSDLTVKELKAEVDRRNEGREESDLIVPESTKKDDLLAALEADDSAE